MKNKPENRLSKLDISEYDILFARTALEINFLTRKDLAKAFTFQKRQSKTGRKLSICEVFSLLNMLPAERLDKLRTITKQRLDRKFGFAALKRKIITQAQLKRALQEQEGEFKATQTCRLTGDILVAQGVITAEQRDRLRKEMRGITPADTKDIGSNGEQQEKINSGPSPQTLFQIEVSENCLEAGLLMNGKGSGPSSVELALKAIQRNGIRYGIVSTADLTAFIDSNQGSAQPFIIARGQMPVPGCDAKIIYHFETDYLTAGKINPDGSINYQERGQVPKVNAGHLLAEKKPMQTGRPGMDIFGYPIPVADPRDIDLNYGPGTRLSKDGMQVYAAIDGRPELAASGKISVFNEMVIDKDVGFNTGNIDFEDRVRIKGAVRNGFAVKCGSLIVQEVVHGKISAVGDVVVQFGIINAEIQTEGRIFAKFITDSNIKSFGDVEVEKEVIHSKIRSSGKVSADNGKIISSFVSAKLGVTAKEIGTDISPPCRIQVGLDENVRKRIQACNFILEDMRKELDDRQSRYEQKLKKQVLIQDKLSTLTRPRKPLPTEDHRPKKKASLLTGRKREHRIKLYLQQMEILEEKIDQDLTLMKTMIAKIEDLSSEKKAIQTWSKKEKGNPVVKVQKHIHQGSKILGIHSATTLNDTLCNVSIKEKKLPGADCWTMAVENID